MSNEGRTRGPSHKGGNRTTNDHPPRDVLRARMLQEIVPGEVNAVHHERIHRISEEGARRRAVAAAKPRQARYGRQYLICWDCGQQDPDVGPTGCNDKKACNRRAETWEVM